MGKKGGTKKLRGSRGSRTTQACDLMVPLPKTAGVSSVERALLLNELRTRLASTGYTHMVLTHTIYGRPKPEDRADVALPSSLWTTMTYSEETNDKKTKKRKLNSSPSSTDDTPEVSILRRLHVVVENQSDMGLYLSNGPQEDLLNEYDLVSVCPTNEVTFQSACSRATMADIITLDYTSRGLKLPYKIRSSDVKAAVERGATFEIPIAPALLHLKQRKALVHACQDLRNSSLGSKPRIVVSSGDRTYEGTDVGALALRLPGDLSNLCKTVMHLDDHTAARALREAALETLQKGRERRFGQKRVAVGSVSLLRKEDLLAVSPAPKRDKTTSKPNQKESKEEQPRATQEDDEDSEDGFMAL